MKQLRQSRKQALVVGALILVLAHFGFGLANGVSVLFSLPALLLYGGVIYRLDKATSSLITSKNSGLDERQRALRNRAHQISYAAFVGFGLFMLGMNFFGLGGKLVAFGVGEVSVNLLLLTANFIVLSALPVLVVAWLEPDPLEDELSLKEAE